jgi:hypothetical protein
VAAWPLTVQGFTLQQNSDLTTTNWVDATNHVQDIGREHQVILPPLAGQQFYRLKYP